MLEVLLPRALLSYGRMLELRELLRGFSDTVPLDMAALQIATIEDPALAIDAYLVLLDSYATEFGERVNPGTSGEVFVASLNQYLFEELGFRGNSANYYDAANSCLNEVLTRRLGIPITLSVVYIEIARRLGRTVHGVGLPGHFLVLVDEPDYQAYVDVYHAGQVLGRSECFDLAREATGLPLTDDPAALMPVSKRHIAVRMLNNLRAIYFQTRQPRKAIQVLDLLIEASPDSAEEYKQRGVCLSQTGKLPEASSDLSTYLELAPNASDRSQVLTELSRIKRMIALQED